MNITEEALDEIEAGAKYGAYVAPGTAVELIEEIRSLRADNADLLEALEGMVSIYAVSTGVNSMACKIEQELTLMARAAIARAQGEA